MRLPQRILTRGVQLRRGRLHFIFRNHFFAAAAVPGQGKAGKQGSSGKNPCCAQRCGQCDEAAGVASRHGDALCRADCFRLGGGKLRKAVDPSGCGAVGGRGVQHHRVRVFNQGHRLPRRRVGQAQDGNVRRIQRACARSGILALLLRQCEERDVGAGRKTFENPEPGRARTAVNKNFFHDFRNSRICAICFLTEETEVPPSLMRFSTQADRSIASYTDLSNRGLNSRKTESSSSSGTLPCAMQ